MLDIGMGEITVGLNPIRDRGLKELCNKEFKNLNILIISFGILTQLSAKLRNKELGIW
jgi:hypothetical protein